MYNSCVNLVRHAHALLGLTRLTDTHESLPFLSKSSTVTSAVAYLCDTLIVKNSLKRI